MTEFNISAIIVVLFLAGMLISPGKQNDKRAMSVCYVIGALLILSAAFRSSLVGADTPDFIDDYRAVRSMTLPNVIDYYSNSMFFFGLSWVFSKMGFSIYWWFGFIEFIYIFSVLYFIKKFCDDKLFAFFCFFTIGLFFPSYNILKQIVSLSFALLSFCSFIDKKKTLAIALFICGFFAHQSILVFALVYLLYIIRMKQKLVVASVIAILLVSLISGSIWANVISGYGNEHYMMYMDSDNDYSSVALYYLILLLAIALITRGYQHRDKHELVFLVGMSALACIMQSFASTFSIAHRLAYFFMPFMLILITNSVSSIKGSDIKLFYKMLFIVIMSFFCIYTQRNIPYIIDPKIVSFIF